jgi:anti-sigma regulatory factor (Ser/Thr protein kinase)
MLIEVSEPSQAGEARRKALLFAEDSDMDESQGGAVAVAVTEMATNLVKHAGKGHILVRPLSNNRTGLEVMSVDQGPGIQDISRALSDGHSTAGSLGTGLGAIKRLSDAFQIYTNPGAGTVVRAEFWQGKAHQTHAHSLEIGVVSEPIAGEEVCGDGWGVKPTADGLVLMVVDGLGHGVLAAEAAREAESVLAKSREMSPQAILHEVHSALKKTRGAALGLARVDPERRLLTFAGVGNISASIVAPGSSRSIASHNGILGGNIERVQEFTLPWNDNNILVMHSDGLMTRWDLSRYPGIWGKHASLIAALLHRDFCRGRDDVTVLVAKAAEVWLR